MVLVLVARACVLVWGVFSTSIIDRLQLECAHADVVRLQVRVQNRRISARSGFSERHTRTNVSR
jgi:hypothetical protein